MEENMKYSIKEVAEKLNISQYTLRYYDKKGLIPYLQRESNGVRRYTDEDIVNILIKYLYKISNGNSKGLLWSCYGDIILNNIKNNIDKPKIKIINCVDCGEEFEISIKNKRTCRCINCNILRKKDINRNKVRKFRSREIQM